MVDDDCLSEWKSMVITLSQLPSHWQLGFFAVCLIVHIQLNKLLHGFAIYSKNS